jgi:hypothetical protein
MINKDVYTIIFPGQVDEDASQRSHPMNRLAALAVGALLLSTTPALAQVPPFPASFRTTTIAANGAQLHVRIGGQGPASCCCMAMARPATCGRPWPALAATTR